MLLTIGYRSVEIHTDSKFLIDCMEKWIIGWKANNWIKKTDKTEVINREELTALDEASQGIEVQYVSWIRVCD